MGLLDFLKTDFDLYSATYYSEEYANKQRELMMIYFAYLGAVDLCIYAVFSVYCPHLSSLWMHLFILSATSVILLQFKLMKFTLMGGLYVAILYVFIESFFLSYDFVPQEETNNFMIAIAPLGFVFNILRLPLNWKLKTLFFFSLTVFKVIVYILRMPWICYSYLTFQIFLLPFFIGIAFFEFEQMFLSLSITNATSTKEKNRWMELLENLPFYIIQFNYEKKVIVKDNKFINNFFLKATRQRVDLNSVMKFKQNIKIFSPNNSGFTQLVNKSFEDVMMKMIQENLQKLSIELEYLGKHLTVIAAPIYEKEAIFLFIDNSLNEQYQFEQIGQKVVSCLYQSLAFRLMSPINTLKSILYYINEQSTDSTVTIQIEKCMEAIFTLEQLNLNLNDLSLSSVNEVSVSNEECQIHQLLKHIHSFFKSEARQKGIQLYIDISFELSQKVIADAKRIKQILFILLHNAVKFTSRGFVLLQATQDSEQGQTQLILEVKDSGCGFERNHLQNVLKLFNNVRALNGIDSPGIGFGLTIINKVVKALKGSIHISSVQNEGTEYKLGIPIQIDQHVFYDFQDWSENSAEFQISSIERQFPDQLCVFRNNLNIFTNSVILSQPLQTQILIVDDDSLNIYALELLIKSQGAYICDEAKNGQEAIEMIKRNPGYRLVVMDVNMPIMNGMDATRELRRMQSQNEIDLSQTLICVHSAIQNNLNCQGLFDGKLTKPIIIEELKQILALISRE